MGNVIQFKPPTLVTLSEDEIDARLQENKPWPLLDVMMLVRMYRAEKAALFEQMSQCIAIIKSLREENEKAARRFVEQEAKATTRAGVEAGLRQLLATVSASFPDDVVKPTVVLRHDEDGDGESFYYAAVVRYGGRGERIDITHAVRAKGRELGSAIERLIVEFDVFLAKGR